MPTASKHGARRIAPTYGTRLETCLLTPQVYAMNTDWGMNKGKHGLLHEFGVYLATRLLREGDDAALTDVWELFTFFFTSVAVMHGFQWTVIHARWGGHVGSMSTLDWATAACARFISLPANQTSPFDNSFDPIVADPMQHIFGECAHGVGHGSQKAIKSNAFCKPFVQRLPAFVHASGDIGRWLRLASVACIGGAGHQAKSK